MVARDGTGRKIARSVTSCAECLAWGLTYCQGVCLACYNFAARYRSHAGGCAACRRRLPVKDGYPTVLVPGPVRPRGDGC